MGAPAPHAASETRAALMLLIGYQHMSLAARHRVASSRAGNGRQQRGKGKGKET
jgi:hypothetical protein